MRAAPAILLLVVLLLILGLGSMYIVPEGQQAVITQFGKPVGDPVTDAGLYFKTPFIQKVHRLEKRLLPWDGEPQNMVTQDKRNIFIDVWARWRIVEPMKFYKAVGTEQNGQQRLDESVDSAVREVIADHKLIEAVRNSNEPLKYESEELERDWAARREQINTGRIKIEAAIKERASEALTETFGIELTDVHIKRINYVKSVREKVYERMSSERRRIANLYKSEAEEEANRILGQMQKELETISGEMEQKSAEIRGTADAEVIRITGESFGKDPRFYEFLRQLEAYKKTLGRGTRLVLSTRNDFLRQIHGPDPDLEE